MRPEEARWIWERLSEIPDENLTPVLEIGASSDEFRRIRRPHIHEYIHGPLLDRGVRIVTTDIKDEDGVDIVGDIYDVTTQEKLSSVKAGCVLCCNILEHIEDRVGFSKAVAQVGSRSTKLLVTVPCSYPVHLDPIDTYFRPTPEEIGDLFPEYYIESSQVLVSSSLMQEWLQRPSLLPYRLLRQLFQLTKFWVGKEMYSNLNHRLLWLFRPYKVSCVLLSRKN